MSPLPPLPLPSSVQLESTLGCNLECVMCGSFLSGVTKKRRVMSPALLAKVEAEVLPGARDLSLTVAGEPLMTPRLSSFIDLAERNQVQLNVHTNGLLFKDEPVYRRLLAQSASIKVSIDAASQEVYETIRIGGDFPLLLEKLKLLARLRSELPPEQRPRLALSMVLMRRNIHELPDLVDLTWQLGYDALAAAHLTVFEESMDSESLRHHPALTDKMLRAARARAAALGVRVHLPPPMDGIEDHPSPRARLRLLRSELRGVTRARLRRLGMGLVDRRLRARWSRRAGGRVPCHFLQNATFISIGGDVTPCPMPGRPVAGNLAHTSFAEIWNGEVLTAMRRAFFNGTPFACCQHCSQNPENYDPTDADTAKPPDNSLPPPIPPPLRSGPRSVVGGAQRSSSPPPG